MGKSGKKPRRNNKDKPQRRQHHPHHQPDDDEEEHDTYPYDATEHDPLDSASAEEESNADDETEQHGAEDDANPSPHIPSKFLLYQQSVQSPKGDISYMLKFFLMYVGGRLPLHLQEDFCGTALLSTEWLRSDARRTAVGLDLDLEALNWCLENNLNKVGANLFSRISLFHGNVLQPLKEARLVKIEPEELLKNVTLKAKSDDYSRNESLEVAIEAHPSSSVKDNCLKKNSLLPARDIVCAFNYSCCCLHRRGDLIVYFKHVLDALSKKGGIFVMDLYGGTSSECKLMLKRRFPNFTYTWEQAEFDIIERLTRISLHYHLHKQQKKIRHAFSYNWRLWSLPEIKDCLEEAGFKSVHFWMRHTPDVKEGRTTEGFGAGREVKYEEGSSFQQQDAWNAYVVGVAK